MKKLTIAIMVLALLAGTVLATHIYVTPFNIENKGAYGQYQGTNRVVNYDPRVAGSTGYIRIQETVYLEPLDGPANIRGYAPYAPRGSARFITSRSLYYPRGMVNVKVKDVPVSYIEGSSYEGWLYDEDSGYYLSLGIFRARQGGVGILQYSADNYLDQYDFIIITKEQYPDTDPNPSEDVVLYGQIPKPDRYTEAQFTSQELLYGKSLG